MTDLEIEKRIKAFLMYLDYGIYKEIFDDVDELENFLREATRILYVK